MHDFSRIATRSSLRAAGWTDAQLAHAVRVGDLRRVLPATYVTGAAPLSAAERVACVQASVGHDVVAVLGTAAELLDLPTPWPVDPVVHVAVPPGQSRHPLPGVRFHVWSLDEDEVTSAGGVRTTTVLRTLVDLMCLTDRMSAVAAVDAALRSGRVPTGAVKVMPHQVKGRRGAARSRGWWSLADGRAESPLETRVRLRAVDAGYPPDDLQHEVVVDGRRLRGDLAWRRPNGRMLIVEADGDSTHGSVEAAAADRRRSNAITSAGDVDLARVVWADTVTRGPVADLLARFLGPRRRRG